MATQNKRLGFFTRVLDETSAKERYRLALEQIRHAEKFGFDTAWVAQHHFHEFEGGLPSPFVLLGQAALQTSRIILGTGVITLPLEDPIRVAEDAAVVSLLSDGRFELGLGSGGTPTSFPPFGHDPKDRPEIYVRYQKQVISALRGDILTTDGGALYPAAPQLLDTLWQATFSAEGAEHIAHNSAGLMLSKTQPHSAGTSGFRALSETQQPIVEAYKAALATGVAPRVFGSRTLVVVDDEAEAERLITRGLERALGSARAQRIDVPDGASRDELRALFDLHVGTPKQVIAEFQEDPVLLDSTDIVFQVHPVDPPHEAILRSLELIASEVAPALGWVASA